MTSSSRSVENVPGKEKMTLESTKNDDAEFKKLQNLKVIQDGHSTDYEGSVVVKEQPFTISNTASRVLPVYTLDWASRTDSYFLPVTGLDFLIGVPEILLLQMTDNLKLRGDSSFVVKIPNGETLYLGIENSTAMQRALFCSQRNFNMAFLDPNKQVAMSFIRKGAVIRFGRYFKQELIALQAESNIPQGSIQQDNSLSTVSFTVLDDHNKHIYKLVCSESTLLRRLNHDVHFSILDPVNRTGGVILHKWDNSHKDFVYHITFPSSGTSPQHKMLLLGVALLVEYTYFKSTGCFCFP